MHVRLEDSKTVEKRENEIYFGKKLFAGKQNHIQGGEGGGRRGGKGCKGRKGEERGVGRE